MKKLLSGILLSFALLGSAWAVNPSTNVGDAAYTILSTDVRIITTTAFTAGRTWTLPNAGASCIGQSCQPAAYQLEINDVAGAFSQAFQLTIAPASGETINNNAANLIISAAKSRILLFPTSGSNWQAIVYGDFQTTGICPSNASTATVTITIAAPGVITDTAHGITGACPVVFTNSGGGLPTGITSGTVYYVVPSSITANTYTLATTVANALAGTQITTTGTSTGTQTRTGGNALTSTTAADITGLSLSQGDWDCRGNISRVLNASTSVTKLVGGINGTSATQPSVGGNGINVISTAANVMGAGGTDSHVGPVRVNNTATGNTFLVATDTFSVSTDNAFGALSCRRVK